MSATRLLFSLVSVIGVICGRHAAANGAFFPTAGSAESSQARLLVVLEGTRTTVVLQRSFTGSATELAWVVPVFALGAAQQVELAPADVFERLDARSAPQAVRLTATQQRHGCLDEGITVSSRVQPEPFAEFAVGEAAFFALDAQLSADIHDWLTGADFGPVCPDLATSCLVDEDCGAGAQCASEQALDATYSLSSDDSAWLAGYVNEGAKLVVAQLGDVQPATEQDPMAPLALQLGGHVPEIPLRTVGNEPLELTLYVIGQERARVAGFPTREIQIDTFFRGTDVSAWYRDRLDDAFAAVGEEAFVVEYAHPIDSTSIDELLGRPPNLAQLGARPWFLTRLRARLNTGHDVTLAPDGEQPFRVRVMAVGGGREARVGPVAWLVALGWSVWRVRRRKR